MKLLITFLLLCSFQLARAQSDPAAILANKIAVKMKDSLLLTDGQKQQVYQLNLQLHQSKATVRQQYAGTDSLRLRVQWVENTRDSLYRGVLDSEQYQLYLQKKRNLINNNQ